METNHGFSKLWLLRFIFTIECQISNLGCILAINSSVGYGNSGFETPLSFEFMSSRLKFMPRVLHQANFLVSYLNRFFDCAFAPILKKS